MLKRVSTFIDLAHTLMDRSRVGDSNVFVMSPNDQVFTYVDANDEMWHFDVAAGYLLAKERYAEAGDRRPTPMFVSDFGDVETVRARYRDLDEVRVRRADTSEPVLCVAWQERGLDGIMLIDGVHRLVRAVETEQLRIPAYILANREDVEAIVLAIADKELTARLMEKGL